MKSLFAPSVLVLLMAVSVANPVAAQQSSIRSIPFVTEAIPLRAPAGAIIQLRVQYDGEPSSLRKYRLEIGGVATRFFLLDDRVPTISAVVPPEVKGASLLPGESVRVPIVFFDPVEAGGLVYSQFSFLTPSKTDATPVLVMKVTDLGAGDNYYDVTFSNNIPVDFWGNIKIYFNDKRAEIVKMEDRVFTVVLPNGVPYDNFKVTATVGNFTPGPLYYDRWGPTPTPIPATTPPGVNWALVIIGLVVLAGLIFIAYSYYRLTKSLSKPSTSSTSDKREELDLPSEIPPDLIQACERGECVLYAGAGLSAQCGLPTWTPFVHGLLDWALENEFITQAEAAEYHDEVNTGQADPVADSLVSKLTTEEDRNALYDICEEFFSSEPRLHLFTINYTRSSFPLSSQPISTTCWRTCLEPKLSRPIRRRTARVCSRLSPDEYSSF